MKSKITVISATLFLSASCGFAADLVNESKTVLSGETYEADSITRNYTSENGVSDYSPRVNAGGSFIVNGDVTNTLTDGYVHTGSFVSGLTGTGIATVTGTVKTLIEGDVSLRHVYGGNGGNQIDAMRAGDNSNVGAVEIVMNSGTLSGYILASGALGSDVMGDVSVTVNGGTIADGIYGVASSAHVYGNVNISVLGGSVSDIYAGGGNGGSTIAGDVNIVIGGTATVENVAGGAWYSQSGAVSGDVSITVKDSAVVTGTISGRGADAAQVFKGDRILNVESYAGTLAVEDFQTVNVTGESDVTFSDAFSANVLRVDSAAKVVLADGTTFSVLSISTDETLESGMTTELQLDTIFGDNAQLVKDALAGSTKLTLVDASGQEWSATYSAEDGKTTATIGATIPEPSAFGLIAGVGALALVAARRRRTK